MGPAFSVSHLQISLESANACSCCFKFLYYRWLATWNPFLCKHSKISSLCFFKGQTKHSFRLSIISLPSFDSSLNDPHASVREAAVIVSDLRKQRNVCIAPTNAELSGEYMVCIIPDGQIKIRKVKRSNADPSSRPSREEVQPSVMGNLGCFLEESDVTAS